MLESEINYQKSPEALAQYCLALVMLFVASPETFHIHHHLTVVDIEAQSCQPTREPGMLD